MAEITYVCFVPKSKRDKLRSVLETEDTSPVRWAEKRSFSGSEFYFSGPSLLVRKAHAYVAWWVTEP